MSAGTRGNMTPTKKPDAEKRNAEREAALTFVRMAKEKGLDLTGPDGLLKQFTKSVLETALDEEMTEHLGRAKHKKSKDGRAANTRNGTTAKTVVTDSVGPVRIEVPRDRDGSFEPVVVRKRQRRLPGVDEVVLSLYARGLTTGEISAHFQEIYGADVSRETVGRITERVMAEKDEWCSRPLDRVYAAVFIDATVVKVRDGQVANRAFYVAVGVDLEGDRDVLGIWASPAAEGALLAVGAHRAEEPGRGRCVLPDLRRAQRPARRGGRGMASGHRADLRGASAAQHVPLRVEEGLGRHQTRCQTHLHRAERRRRGGGPRRDAGQVGGEISRDPQAVDGRVGTVHTVPGL